VVGDRTHPATEAIEREDGMATPHLGGRVRLLGAQERTGMDPALLEMVEYRKSGLSLNWIVGCPLDCGYCVRHLFGNFGLKVPRALSTDAEAFTALTGHRFFRPHATPVQLLNRATDPMLPLVKPHLFAMLRMLDDAGLTNQVLVITRWRGTNPDYRHRQGARSPPRDRSPPPNLRDPRRATGSTLLTCDARSRRAMRCEITVAWSATSTPSAESSASSTRTSSADAHPPVRRSARETYWRV
jgi:hypothetical protein